MTFKFPHIHYSVVMQKWQKTPKLAITWGPEPRSQGTTAPLHHMECSTHHDFAAPETQYHPVLKSALSCRAHNAKHACNILAVPTSLETRHLGTYIWGFSCWMWCCVIKCVVPTFWTIIMPPPHSRAVLLQNIGNHSSNDTVSHPRRPEPSETPLWEPKQTFWMSFKIVGCTYSTDHTTC